MASTPTSRLRLNKQGTYDNPETWGIELNNGMIDMVDSAFGGFSATISGDISLTVENYTADQARQLFMILDGAGGFTITVPAVDKLYYVINDCADDVTITPLGGTGAVVRAGTAMWWYCDGTDGFVKDPTLDQILPPEGDIDFNGNRLTSLAAGFDPTDAASLSNEIGDFASPTAPVDLGGQKLVNVAPGENLGDVATLANSISDFTAASASLNLGAQRIVNLANPSAPSDGVSWSFVEGLIAAVAGINLPSMSGHAGEFLTTDGTLPSWAPPLPALAGNEGKYLRVSAGAPAWGDVPVGLNLITTQAVAAPVASVDFVSGIDSTYDEYWLQIYNALPATDSAVAWLRTSPNAGSTWDASGSDYDYAGTSVAAGGATVSANQSAAAAQIVLTNDVGNAAGENGYSASIAIIRPSLAHRCAVRWSANAPTGAGVTRTYIGSGSRLASSAVSGIRFMFSTGNIQSGIFKLYGVRK